MIFVEYTFPKIYAPFEAQENITKVRKVFFDMYDEYVAALPVQADKLASYMVAHLIVRTCTEKAF